MIYVHLADGFEEIEAVTIVDVLRRAEVTVETVSMTGKKEVTGAHRLTVLADILYEDANYEQCEMIVLPGGMPGTTNLAAHEGLIKHIKCFADQGKKLAAICAAPMVFGQIGLLKGKKATIYAGMENYLTGAQYCADEVVKDGNVITSKGPGTAAAFALALVAEMKGKDAAEQVKAGMLIK